MKTHTSTHYSVTMPNAWEAEFDQEDECDVLYKPDGHGELCISSVAHEEHLSSNDLKFIAEEDLHAGARFHEIDLGMFQGFWFDYEVDGAYWCEWYLACGRLMLFVTYTCPVDREGQENTDVDMIISTLSPDEKYRA